jgi:hypothetical protein
MQRLADLIDKFRVYALCVPCGRMEALDLAAIDSGGGGAMTVAELRERVRCRGCGQRTRDIRIVYVGPADRPAAFHYRR